jgi:hypothetical protein
MTSLLRSFEETEIFLLPKVTEPVIPPQTTKHEPQTVRQYVICILFSSTFHFRLPLIKSSQNTHDLGGRPGGNNNIDSCLKNMATKNNHSRDATEIHVDTTGYGH